MHFKHMKQIVLALTLLLTFSTVQVMAQDHPKGNTEEGIGQQLPPFDFEGTDGNRVTPANVAEGKPVIVFYFDPFCDHCQKQAGWINDNATMFKDITLLWVAYAEIKDIKAFPEKYLPKVDSKIVFANDDKYQFDNYFGYSTVPSIYVYNSKHVRTASFKSETLPATLLRFAIK
jgi:cytochrome oxidase Cu insertion factor (SCO1/SenC/PrrC family)